MFWKEDRTYDEIRERSIRQWLGDMSHHEDIAVRGGVRVTTDYINDLKRQIAVLEEKNALKDDFLKRMREKYKKSQNK